MSISAWSDEQQVVARLPRVDAARAAMHDHLAVEHASAALADHAAERLVAARVGRDVVDSRVVVDVLAFAREQQPVEIERGAGLAELHVDVVADEPAAEVEEPERGDSARRDARLRAARCAHGGGRALRADTG